MLAEQTAMISLEPPLDENKQIQGIEFNREEYKTNQGKSILHSLPQPL